MRKTVIKRVVYIGSTGDQFIGNQEYIGSLPDRAILDAIHKVGQTQWIGSNLYVMRGGIPKYRIEVYTVTQYEKSWYNYLLDAIRRI